jgi:ribosomal protein S18 acetylase RimI-like enzyme
MTASIRPATVADAAGVRACLEAAFEPYRGRYTPAAFADTVPTPERLVERFARMTVIVAVAADGAIAGTLAFQDAADGEGHLRGLAVLPAHSGTGIAEALLLTAERALQAAGCTRVTLDTTAPLERAIRFYEKHGYRASGRVTDVFGMPLFEYAKAI